MKIERFPLLVLGVVLLLGLGSSARAEEEERSAGGKTVKGLELTGFWIPALTLDTNPDLLTENLSLRATEHADVKTGRGFGGRIGFYGHPFGDNVWLSFGAEYLQAEHRERSVHAFTRTHLALVDARLTFSLPKAPISPYGGVVLGLGGGAVHIDRFYSDGGGVAGEMGLLAGLRLFEHVDIGAGAVIYGMGYPGTTVGTGVYFPLEVTIRF